MVPWSSSAFNVPTPQCVEKKQDDYYMNMKPGAVSGPWYTRILLGRNVEDALH